MLRTKAAVGRRRAARGYFSMVGPVGHRPRRRQKARISGSDRTGLAIRVEGIGEGNGKFVGGRE